MMTLLYTSQQITYIAILKTGKMRNSSVNELKVLASHFVRISERARDMVKALIRFSLCLVLPRRKLSLV